MRALICFQDLRKGFPLELVASQPQAFDQVYSIRHAYTPVEYLPDLTRKQLIASSCHTHIHQLCPLLVGTYYLTGKYCRMLASQLNKAIDEFSLSGGFMGPFAMNTSQ